MSAFQNAQTIDGFTMKLWRGEHMCLIGFDVESPPADLVGFAIECRFPGTDAFKPLLNRIAFAYDEPTHSAVDGQRKFSSLEAPFQKFRWVHVPHEVEQGTFTYRGRMMHMANDGQLVLDPGGRKKRRSPGPDRGPENRRGLCHPGPADIRSPALSQRDAKSLHQRR